MTSKIITPAAPAKISQHFGAIGDRIVVKGVLRACHRFGDKFFNIIEDHDGNVFTLRSRRPYAKSARVLVATEGTVAAHVEYKGELRTELTGTTQQNYDAV